MARRSADGDHVVDAAREGDEEAWRALYRAHHARLVALLRTRVLGDAAAAPEDVMGDAWLTAAAQIQDFSGSDDDFAGWLYTIARNHALNRDRTARRRGTSPTSEPPEPHAALHDDAATRDVADVVAGDDRTRRLLAHLSPREAEVVACVDVAGLDVAATARALGMRPTAVRVARHRALGRLRRLLAEEDEATGAQTAAGGGHEEAPTSSPSREPRSSGSSGA